MNEDIKHSIFILTVLRELNHASKNHYSVDVREFCAYLLNKAEKETKVWDK